MRWSFRTNGNFIDFVHTDETSMAVESVIFHLHNTSRCVDWSLPSDTTKINFTIDGVKYENIPITDVDFDGTVMNSQDDFETGIEAMFTGLAGGGSGGVESVTLEEYENSAMSAPVMAYVFRDEDDNIFRVYEPLRNNDVSRKTYSYADSIDKFRFDKAENYGNALKDVKLVDIHSGTVFEGCTLETMIINATSKTGVIFRNHYHKGNHGIGAEDAGGHGEEIYITGNGVLLDGNFCLGARAATQAVLLDELGANSIVRNNFFAPAAILLAHNKQVVVSDNDFQTYSTLDCEEGGNFVDNVFGNSCYVLNTFPRDGSGNPAINHNFFAPSSGDTTLNCANFNGNSLDVRAHVTANDDTQNCKFGASCNVTINDTLDNSVIGDSAWVTISAATANKNYINIGGTAYEIGEDTGAATLTAV